MDTFSITTYNIQEPPSRSPHLYGGTGITLIDKFSSRKMLHGYDSTGLGQWTWTLIQGKASFSTRIVSAYRPVENRKDIGSVWNQHVLYLRNNEDLRNPQESFDEDLTALVLSWIEEGNNVILGVDANEDIRNGKFSKLLQLLPMTEGITTHHWKRSPPGTQHSNSTRTPIDGIWIMPSSEIAQAGHLAFGSSCPSDHKIIWIDVTTSSILGSRPPKLLKAVSNRLNAKDP